MRLSAVGRVGDPALKHIVCQCSSEELGRVLIAQRPPPLVFQLPQLRMNHVVTSPNRNVIGWANDDARP